MKKLALLVSLALTTNCFANSAVTKLYPIQEKQPKNVDLTFKSHSDVYVTNTSAGPQTVGVCYTIRTCSNLDKSQWRVNQECTTHTIVSSDTFVELNKQMQITVNYPYNGQACLIESFITIRGAVNLDAHDSAQTIIR